MCGRFTLRTPASQLVEIFGLSGAAELRPRFNIAPTQPVAAVRHLETGRELSLLRWGLIPPWSKDASIGARMINARGETVASKPSFRAALASRRCLIPADGFYEWKKTGGRTKQPFYIGMQDGRPFAFAGLWERWEGPAQPVCRRQPKRFGNSTVESAHGAKTLIVSSTDSTVIESCTIITTEANRLLAELHDRMPVILDPADYTRWLDPRLKDTNELQSLLVPYPEKEMQSYPVSTVVSNPRNETPACVEPVRTEETE